MTPPMNANILNCDYCGCQAEKHFGWEKVKKEFDKIKIRIDKPVNTVDAKMKESSPVSQPTPSFTVQESPQMDVSSQPNPQFSRWSRRV